MTWHGIEKRKRRVRTTENSVRGLCTSLLVVCLSYASASASPRTAVFSEFHRFCIEPRMQAELSRRTAARIGAEPITISRGASRLYGPRQLWRHIVDGHELWLSLGDVRPQDTEPSRRRYACSVQDAHDDQATTRENLKALFGLRGAMPSDLIFRVVNGSRYELVTGSSKNIDKYTFELSVLQIGRSTSLVLMTYRNHSKSKRPSRTPDS